MDHRQGFLGSAVVHLTLLSLLIGFERAAPPPVEPDERHETSRVFLPPPAVLRELAAVPAAPAPPPPPPPPAPTPPPPAAKDRISVGAPSDVRQRGPLVLRREDDLTAVARGRPDAAPSPAPTPAPPPEPASRGAGGRPEREGDPGLRLPPLGGPRAAGDDGARAQPGERGRSITSSLRNLERFDSGTPGVPSGTGRQMGPLFFDPQGADFTVWVNHFKTEVYRNWMVPQGALLGIGGEVQLRFTCDRSGRIVDLQLIRSSGTTALDHASRGALLGSLLMPLPADYAPATLTIDVTFFYGRAPENS